MSRRLRSFLITGAYFMLASFFLVYTWGFTEGGSKEAMDEHVDLVAKDRQVDDVSSDVNLRISSKATLKHACEILSEASDNNVISPTSEVDWKKADAERFLEECRILNKASSTGDRSRRTRNADNSSSAFEDAQTGGSLSEEELSREVIRNLIQNMMFERKQVFDLQMKTIEFNEKKKGILEEIRNLIPEVGDKSTIVVKIVPVSEDENQTTME